MSAVCFECNTPAEHDHHVVPRSLGGTKTIPLCERCHGLVHDKKFTKISTLTRNALAAKKAKMQRVGAIPYGWKLKADGVHLERCEVEQAVVAKCHALRAQGWALAAIAAELERQGVPTRTGGKWHAMQIKRYAGRWHSVRVFRILEAQQ